MQQKEEMVVQYKTVDQLAGIAQASAQMFEHIHLGQVTVYGNENTAGPKPQRI